MAKLNHAAAVKLAGRLAAISGVEVISDTFFNEFTLRLARPAAAVVEDLAGKGLFAGVPVSRLLPAADGVENLLLVAVTEANSENDMDRLVAGLEEALR